MLINLGGPKLQKGRVKINGDERKGVNAHAGNLAAQGNLLAWESTTWDLLTFVSGLPFFQLYGFGVCQKAFIAPFEELGWLVDLARRLAWLARWLAWVVCRLVVWLAGCRAARESRFEEHWVALTEHWNSIREKLQEWHRSVEASSEEKQRRNREDLERY